MSVQPSKLLRRRLRCDASAPHLARSAVSELVGTSPVRADALLVTSELVSNAVQHSGCGASDALDLTAELTEDGLRIAVTDPGQSGAMPRLGSRGAGAVSGIGLHLVELLARRWGTERHGGLQVWAELALE